MNPMLVIFFLLLIHGANGEQCVFRSPCACNTPDYKIDLEPMMKENGDPLKVNNGRATFYLNPCGKPLTVSDCRDLGASASGCQIEGPYPYGIASTTGYSASGDPKAGNVEFTYSFGIGSEKRTTKMKLACSSHDRKFTYVRESPIETYNFLLETKYACKDISSGSGGLSTGSILVIIFFVFLIVYIIGGILFLKYYRKNEGVEIIPNHSFWKEIPLLVKEGFVFTFSKCKRDSTYDKI